MDDREIGVYLFYCANCMTEAESQALRARLGVEGVRLQSLPCSGKVNIPYLVKAFETGADGVVVLTCETDECRHLEGNRRAKKRVQAVDSLLDEIGMGTGRIAVFEVRRSGQEQTMALMKDFCETVRRTPIGNGVEAAN